MAGAVPGWKDRARHPAPGAVSLSRIPRSLAGAPFPFGLDWAGRRWAARERAALSRHLPKNVLRALSRVGRAGKSRSCPGSGTGRGGRGRRGAARAELWASALVPCLRGPVAWKEPR